MIKPVEEIPMSLAKKRESYRDQIRKDIREALDKGISKFEFVGDYKYKYLAQYAREEADRIVWKMATDYISELPGEETLYINSYEVKKLDVQPIKIISYKANKESEPRVFCEINLWGFEQALDRVVKEKLEIRQKREERGKLKMEANDETESFDFSEELL